jgi:hypothetical protein
MSHARLPVTFVGIVIEFLWNHYNPRQIFGLSSERHRRQDPDALNSPGLVSPETLRRVQEAVRETGYVPNLVAGSLASNRSKLIVALVPSVSGSVFAETLESMRMQRIEQADVMPATVDVGFELIERAST